ncbi:MAG: shikimate dehydrogenase [Eubacteriales bacterium]|nr:shikimate dehydrogenase [Eubacteriales bacterium]MDD4327785.1 shikimate dehydrogenase [Eubacteriales bacterium]MDD4717465.1 shikimate dehydrogenase [Eubacteriales bacterium]
MELPEKATTPTMYFVGVTTAKSSIMRVFPRWVEYLGLKGAVLKGIDLKIHDERENYRKTVDFIKNDPLSLGALVTTHKLDIFESAEDMFDYLDPFAERFGELSSISKNSGKLEGHAKDFMSCGLAMEAFISKGHWKQGGEVFIMGAGGSALAITTWLTSPDRGEDRPAVITLSNRSPQRLEEAKSKLVGVTGATEIRYALCPLPEDNDRILGSLPAHSVVINATGLGKDRPGSPLTGTELFPLNGLVWELNYRGDLLFMKQALEQADDRKLTVEDGWIYFVHGWTQVITQVFHIDLTPEMLSDCSEIAKGC